MLADDVINIHMAKDYLCARHPRYAIDVSKSIVLIIILLDEADMLTCSCSKSNSSGTISKEA